MPINLSMKTIYPAGPLCASEHVPGEVHRRWQSWEMVGDWRVCPGYWSRIFRIGVDGLRVRTASSRVLALPGPIPVGRQIDERHADQGHPVFDKQVENENLPGHRPGVDELRAEKGDG